MSELKVEQAIGYDDRVSSGMNVEEMIDALRIMWECWV